MAIAKASASALATDEIRAVVHRHIVDYLAAFNLFDKRSGGDEYDSIGCGYAVALCALTVASVFGNEFSLVSEGEKGV